jgi:cytochrome c553
MKSRLHRGPRLEFQKNPRKYTGRNKMRKSTFRYLSWLMLAAVTLQSPAVLADPVVHANIANGQTIYNQGKGAAMACGGCHGAKALGMDAMGASRLANIGQVYVFKQLNDYAADKRTDAGTGALMNGIAKALDEQDRRDVAAYLDSLEFETEVSDLKALAATGVKVGNPKKGGIIMAKGIKPLVPACQNCHGFGGRAANVPAIHQQKYVYLVNQMKRYRDGSRANDPVVYEVGIMRGIAKKLTNENIADIAAYLSTDITP